jgi:hypothetical protein
MYSATIPEIVTVSFILHMQSDHVMDRLTLINPAKNHNAERIM